MSAYLNSRILTTRMTSSKPSRFGNSFRRVHMDFHNARLVPSIGEQFDGDQYVLTLKQAHIQSHTFFAKDVYGHYYYPTKTEGVVHPTLQKDLVAEVTRASRQHGLECIIYYNLCWDNRILEKHSDWAQILRDGSALLGPDDDLGDFGWVCLNSPYLEQLVLPSLEELIGGYDFDGLFFDIIAVHDSGCFCSYCQAKMQEQHINPDDSVQLFDFHRQTKRRALDRITRFIRQKNNHLAITYNNMWYVGGHEFAQYVDWATLESLPFGWRYIYTPTYSRYLRSLDIPVELVTARFLKLWGDFGSFKHPNQLKFELATGLAHGLRCTVGDQLHPSGQLDQRMYRALADVFDFVRQREPWCAKHGSVANIAVIAPKEHILVPEGEQGEPKAGVFGAVKLLMETHYQFDVIDEDSAFDCYAMVIVPDLKLNDAPILSRLKAFACQGGCVMVAGLPPQSADRMWDTELLGCELLGASQYRCGYFRLPEEHWRDMPLEELVFYERYECVRAAGGAKSLGHWLDPMHESLQPHYVSHWQGPPGEPPDHPFAVINTLGAGQVLCLTASLFRRNYLDDNHLYRRVLHSLVAAYAPDQYLSVDAPTTVEAVANHDEQGRCLVHLINYTGQRRTGTLEPVEEMIPVHDIRISTAGPISSAVAQPEGKQLSIRREGSGSTVLLPVLHLHTIVELTPKK